MTDWPDTLPQRFLRNGLSETLADNVIRSQVDRGPAKVRRRTISNVRQLSASMRMSHAEWSTFLTFYMDILKQTLPFNMPDPFDENATITVRFVSVPRKTYFSPGAVRVDMSLEIMS